MTQPAAAIGLEFHVQLATRSKLFCACAAASGGPPNTRTCPTCLGLPGALPSPSREALVLATRAALVLGCTVRPLSRFDRKHYFYPDLAKGYQITQEREPLAERGALAFAWGGEERHLVIRRLHLEEDAGKNQHGGAGPSGVDFNRAGVPLIEVVTEPTLAAPGEAHAVFAALRELLVAAGVTSGRMEEGALRCDANVSLRDPSTGALGTRVEVKNLNSLKFVERALAHEIRRQEAALKAGGAVRQETRLFDPGAGVTHALRSKEEAEEYRFFPEPDLPPLRVDDTLLAEARAGLGELPPARRSRYREAWGLSAYDAAVLTADAACAAFFEGVAEACGDPKAAANWVMTEVLRVVKEREEGWVALPFTPGGVGGLLTLLSQGRLTGSQAKGLFARVASGELGEEAALRAASEAAPLTDPGDLAPLVARVLAENPGAVQTFRNGRANVLGFLVGRVLEASGGRAEPAQARRLLEEALRA